MKTNFIVVDKEVFINVDGHWVRPTHDELESLFVELLVHHNEFVNKVSTQLSEVVSKVKQLNGQG